MARIRLSNKTKEGIKSSVLIIFAVYILLNIFGLAMAKDGKRNIGPRLQNVSLYDNKKDEYQKKISKARKLFKSEPVIHEPFYVVRFGVSTYNAEYAHQQKLVWINEGLIVDFKLEELSAIIAHELAHAELMEKTSGKETRKHWQVDIRAAELTDPDWVESALLKSDRRIDDEFNSIGWLRKRKYIFLPAYYFESHPYVESKKECAERLSYIRMMKKLLPPHTKFKLEHWTIFESGD